MTQGAVPVAQLDKASDYESEDWGFKSLQGYFFIFCELCQALWYVGLAACDLLCLDARGV